MIKLLDENLINHIAAGEVIENPAAVIRELLDNSIDAKANDISIYIENGGRRLIRISDNGIGMSKKDALMSIERHATSKINDLKDLQRVKTLGFRGEALSSIAAVSRLKIKTKSKDSDLATEILLSGGVIEHVGESTREDGSEIEARSLFFNTPARRNFLKAPKTEEKKILDWILKSSLVNPHIRYRLYFDNKEVLNLSKKENSLLRAKDLFKGSSFDFYKDFGKIKVSGLLSHPGNTLNSTTSLSTFVNGRLVTDKIILRAIKDGYGSMLKSREYPVGYLDISLKPSDFDVNVHPQKSEIRFKKSSEVFQAIKTAIEEALNK
ncbi:UNVERIFIED_CONTAM: hypothetical protein GTU68_066726, partial [Idotea baltica]|nr:hypothetical protein [Idotea baltica]